MPISCSLRVSSPNTGTHTLTHSHTQTNKRTYHICNTHATHTRTHTLTQVETAVAQRAERGNLQLAGVFGYVNTLRATLLGCDPVGGEAVLPQELANKVCCVYVWCVCVSVAA